MTKESPRNGNRVGYGSPPHQYRWPSGFCPNPLGRPPGSGKKSPPPHLYDEILTFRENGRNVKIPRGELLVRRAEKLASGGDQKFVNLLLAQKRKLDTARQKSANDKREMRGPFIRPQSRVSSVEDALVRFCMAVKLYAFRSTARMALERWLVEAALQRLNGKKFTREEQLVIMKSTHCAHKVKWPDWWEPDLRGNKRKYTRNV